MPDSKQQIVPCLWFNDDASQAAEFYLSVFADSQLGSLNEYPQRTGPAEKGSVLFVDFQVMCQDQTEIDYLWNALSAVPEATQCGWCKDQFGVSWQIAPANIAELMERLGAFTKLLAMKKIETDRF